MLVSLLVSSPFTRKVWITNYMTILTFEFLYLCVFFLFWRFSLLLILTMHFNLTVLSSFTLLSLPFTHEFSFLFLSLHHSFHTFSYPRAIPIAGSSSPLNLFFPSSTCLSLHLHLCLPPTCPLSCFLFPSLPSSTTSICTTYGRIWEKHP